jgi:DNA (cytosine-5)-methyltransferase 1
MGFDDEDVEKAAMVCSNSQLYKQAGNSIVVNVLMAIFKELLVPKKTRSEWLDELLGGV